MFFTFFFKYKSIKVLKLKINKQIQGPGIDKSTEIFFFERENLYFFVKSRSYGSYVPIII